MWSKCVCPHALWHWRHGCNTNVDVWKASIVCSTPVKLMGQRADAALLFFFFFLSRKISERVVISLFLFHRALPLAHNSPRLRSLLHEVLLRRLSLLYFISSSSWTFQGWHLLWLHVLGEHCVFRRTKVLIPAPRHFPKCVGMRGWNGFPSDQGAVCKGTQQNSSLQPNPLLVGV